MFRHEMTIIERIHQLLKILNTNEYDNEEKVYVNSTNFIRKLKYFYFTIIGEKASSNITLAKIYYYKLKTDTYIWNYVSPVG